MCPCHVTFEDQYGSGLLSFGPDNRHFLSLGRVFEENSRQNKHQLGSVFALISLIRAHRNFPFGHFSGRVHAQLSATHLSLVPQSIHIQLWRRSTDLRTLQFVPEVNVTGGLTFDFWDVFCGEMGVPVTRRQRAYTFCDFHLQQVFHINSTWDEQVQAMHWLTL